MARKVKSKPAKVRQQPKKVANKVASKVASKVVSQPDPELIVFERGIALFNAGQFQAAKEAFAKLASARNRDLAHSATLRIRMCDQRLAPPENPAE